MWKKYGHIFSTWYFSRGLLYLSRGICFHKILGSPPRVGPRSNTPGVRSLKNWPCIGLWKISFGKTWNTLPGTKFRPIFPGGGCFRKPTSLEIFLFGLKRSRVFRGIPSLGYIFGLKILLHRGIFTRRIWRGGPSRRRGSSLSSPIGT